MKNICNLKVTLKDGKEISVKYEPGLEEDPNIDYDDITRQAVAIYKKERKKIQKED